MKEYNTAPIVYAGGENRTKLTKKLHARSDTYHGATTYLQPASDNLSAYILPMSPMPISPTAKFSIPPGTVRVDCAIAPFLVRCCCSDDNSHSPTQQGNIYSSSQGRRATARNLLSEMRAGTGSKREERKIVEWSEEKEQALGGA